MLYINRYHANAELQFLNRYFSSMVQDYDIHHCIIQVRGAKRANYLLF